MSFIKGGRRKEIVGSDVSGVDVNKNRVQHKLESLLIAESKITSKNNIANLIKKYKKLYLPAILLIFLITVLIVFSFDNTEEKGELSLGCSYAMLEQASQNFAPDKVDALHDISHEIEAINNYREDVNCLYVMLAYSINMSDAERSREYFDLLLERYESDKGYSPAIKDHALTPDQLKLRVEFLEELHEQALEREPQGVKL